MPGPISFTDEQLQAIHDGAAPIRRAQRSDYLQAVADALPRGQAVTNAAILQAVRQAQQAVISGSAPRPQRQWRSSRSLEHTVCSNGANVRAAGIRDKR